MRNFYAVRKNRIMLAALLVLVTVMPVQAAGNTGHVKQIVFLLDGSQSMAGERWQEALDSVLMISSMLPSGYQTALLVYSEDINASVAFDQSMAEHVEELRKINQGGYTNTGAALETALEMFSEDMASEKRVVIISDGEISMRTQQETEAASAVYNAAVEEAHDRNVAIDVLLFPTEEIEEQITFGAEQTDGYIFYESGRNTAERFAQGYLFDLLGLERVTLGLSDSSDSLVNVTLQDTLAENARILLLADGKIEDVQVSCQCKDIQIVQGGRFAVIKLDRPMEENVSLQYTLSEKGRVNAYLVKEYSLDVSSEAVYVPETSNQNIVIHMTNAAGKDILADAEVREAIKVYVDGRETPYEVHQGSAVLSYPAEVSKEIALRVDFGDLNSVVYCEGAEQSLWLEVPLPLETPKEDGVSQYFWLFVVLAFVCAAFVILLILLAQTRKKKTEEGDGDEPKKPGFNEILKHDLSGKVVIYVLKSKGDEDIPPASINLYARKSREALSFKWMADRCRLGLDLRDADKILFRGGENHTLCVKNSGDATLVREREILLKEKKYLLGYSEKILMIFNDGEIEIELHYKNIKPSEREG